MIIFKRLVAFNDVSPSIKEEMNTFEMHTLCAIRMFTIIAIDVYWHVIASQYVIGTDFYAP